VHFIAISREMPLSERRCGGLNNLMAAEWTKIGTSQECVDAIDMMAIYVEEM
jgi:hypothetical protein